MNHAGLPPVVCDSPFPVPRMWPSDTNSKRHLPNSESQISTTTVIFDRCTRKCTWHARSK